MAALLAPASASAATITVTSAEDDSATECTLRDAIEAAKLNAVVDGCGAGEAGPALDTIRFALPPNAQIQLGSELPPLGGPVHIAGPGIDELLIDGKDSNQILELPSGQSATISWLKIRGGFCLTDGNSCAGGAVRNAGSLTLEGVTIQESLVEATGVGAQVARGGAIFNAGDLTLIESVVSGSQARANGGTSNLAAGGAIYNGGSLTLDRSTLDTNYAIAQGDEARSNGGGVANEGTLAVVRSTLKGNASIAEAPAGPALALGGGVGSATSPGGGVRIERSTLTGNSVESSPAEFGGVALGGAISATGSGAFSLVGSTVSANFGLGAANLEISGPGATVRDTIVASPDGGPSCASPLPSAGFNLDDGTSCGFNLSTDLSSAEPKLGTLADNGGPTETMAPEEGSPAIDRGLAGAGEAIDQRGLPRRSDFPGIANAVGGDGADIGAVELQGGLLPGETLPAGPLVPVSLPPTPDLIAPMLKLGKGPGKTTFDRTPTFRFGSEPGARFDCKVDKGHFIGCRSPFTTKRLRFGKHRVKLRATDAAGNASAVAVRSFEVLRPRR